MLRDTGFLAPYFAHHIPWLYTDSVWWTILGFVASFMFSMRFVIQWYHSEKHKKIIVPTSFWILSFFGSILQLVYLFHVDRAPLILSYIFLPVINLRSLIIHLRHQDENGGDEKSSQEPTSKESDRKVVYGIVSMVLLVAVAGGAWIWLGHVQTNSLSLGNHVQTNSP